MKRLIKKASAECKLVGEIHFKIINEYDDYPYYDDDYGVDYIEELNSCLSKEMSSYGGKGLAANINFDDLGFEDGLVESIIVSAEVRGESVYSITTIKSSRDLTTAEKMKLKEDITGQFSDGFGEGFEQRAIADWMESYEVDEEGYEDEDGEWVDGESHLEPMVHELYAQLWTPETTYTFE